MSSIIYRFGRKFFTFEEFIELTKYKKGYGRNLLTKLKKQEIISILPGEKDKRKRLYKLNWDKIKQLIIFGGKEKNVILQNLPLSKYQSEYVALKNFEVIDHDYDLLQLIQRVFNTGIDPDIVITNVGEPKQVLIHEFG